MVTNKGNSVPINLVYLNKKIYMLTNRVYPGYLTIFNAENGVEEKVIDIVTDFGRSPYFLLSEMLLSSDKKYIYFGSSSPERIYRYNVESDKVEYLPYDRDRHNFTLVGFREVSPLNIDNDKVLFTTSKGFIELVSYDNLATPIYTTRANHNVWQSTSGGINIGISKDYIFATYNDYICSFRLSDGSYIKCVKYVANQQTEVTNKGKIHTDSENNFYFFTLNKTLGRIYIHKYNSNLEKLSSTITWYGGDSTGYFVNENGTVSYQNYDNLFNYSFETGIETKLYKGTYNHGSTSGYASIPSPTAKGNFYVLLPYKTGNITKHYVFKYKSTSNLPKPCPLNFYCDSTPKHNPVILVHGLGGHYTDWFNGKREKLKNSILEEFRKDDPEFPESWIYGYSYGYNFYTGYNYQGRLEDISNNMHFDVERLSNEHKLAGGDGKVDIIAYSLGGLVSRHYILEKTGYPGVQNLQADHKIRKLILVASPVNGSTIVTKLQNGLTGNNSIDSKLLLYINSLFSTVMGKDINVTQDVWRQLNTEYEYVNSVRSVSLPTDIFYYKSISNIELSLVYSLFSVPISKKLDIGDGAVLVEDSYLPVQFKNSYQFKYTVPIIISVKPEALDFNLDSIENGNSYSHTEILDLDENTSLLLSYLKEK